MTAEQDKVRELQRTLYRAAKADPGRRFHALYDKVYRRDVLERAWGQVRANRGAAGIDRVTLTAVEQYGIERLLDELAADLKEGSYRPLPARRVFIPKPGSQERRPLSIPTVRDRVVQAALKTVIDRPVHPDARHRQASRRSRCLAEGHELADPVPVWRQVASEGGRGPEGAREGCGRERAEPGPFQQRFPVHCGVHGKFTSWFSWVTTGGRTATAES
jgi:hypothetical protein